MSTEYEKVEIELEDAKSVVRIRDAALRLTQNADFKLIIADGYFKQEASRLTELLGEKSGNNAAVTVIKDEDVIKDLYAIASLKRYLRMIELNGNIMEKAVSDYTETLDQMRHETQE